MRKLLLSITSSALLLAPIAAHAAFETPAQLMTALQTRSARSFNVTAHGSSDGTYVSVWAKGASEGENATTAKVNMSATVDMVKGDFTMRAKGDVLMTDGTAYVKVSSVNGSLANSFGSFSAMLKQKQWLMFPFEESMMGINEMFMDIGTMSMEDADTMYTMQHTVSKGVNVYTLNLTQDSAIELALQIRNMLGDHRPVSNDFFPWRELAEGVRFEMVVRTDANDTFLSSSITVGLSNKNANFEATVNETALKSGVTVSAPKDAISPDELMMLLSNSASEYLQGEPVMMEEEPAFLPADADMMTEPTPDSSSWMMESEIDAECMDPDLTSLKLLMLQRTGTCPITKAASTRASEYRGR